MIKNGLLKCDQDHYVNEDGDIVSLIHEENHDEMVEINGVWVKGPTFNFITQSALQEKEKHHKKKDRGVDKVDDMISNLKQQIDMIKQHANENLSPKPEGTHVKKSVPTIQSPIMKIEINETNEHEPPQPKLRFKNFSLDVVANQTTTDQQPSSRKKFTIPSAKGSMPSYEMKSTGNLIESTRNANYLQLKQSMVRYVISYIIVKLQLALE